MRNELLAYIKEHSYRENHETPFTLASGKKSPYYFDLKQTLFHPIWCNKAVELMFKQIKEVTPNVKAVAGLTMGSDPLVYLIAMSQSTENLIYPIVIRKKSKDHGTAKRAEGLISALKPSDEVVLIDDVITTGGSTLQADEVLRELGFKPKHAFCVVDRKEGGKENLQARGVELHSLFDLDDFR